MNVLEERLSRHGSRVMSLHSRNGSTRHPTVRRATPFVIFVCASMQSVWPPGYYAKLLKVVPNYIAE